MNEEQEATLKAEELRKKLGKGNWEIRIWKNNLGFHCSVKLIIAPGLFIEVYPREDKYWIDSRLPEQFHLYAKDPKKGIKDVLNEALTKAENINNSVKLALDSLK